MTISIIIPILNDERVSYALDSILSQKHSHNLELIIVDGGSKNKILNILEQYRSKISIFISEKDNGIYDAMNKGIVKSSGEIIGILSANDYYKNSSVIQDVLAIFNNDKTVDACYGNVVYIDKKEKIIRQWKADEYKKWKLYYGWMPPHPTFFLKKIIYENFGMFDLNYKIAADYDLTTRLLIKNRIKIRYLNKALVIMSLGGKSSKISNRLEHSFEIFHIWKALDPSWAFLMPVIKPLAKIFQFSNPIF